MHQLLCAGAGRGGHRSRDVAKVVEVNAHEAECCLWRPDEMTAALRLLALKPDVHSTVQQVEVAAGKSKQLATAETPEGSKEHECSKLWLDRVG